MANTKVTSSIVLREVTLGFVNSLAFTANCDRTYSGEYVQQGAKVGDTVRARLPQRWEVKDGAAYQGQDVYDRTVRISLTNQKHIDFALTSQELALEIDDLRERYIQPAADTLANAYDALIFGDVYSAVFSSIGTPGTVPTTNKEYLQAVRKIVDQAGPTNRLTAVLDPEQMVELVNANLSLFNPSQKIGEMWKNGLFGSGALGVREWYQSQNSPAHTTGAITTAASPKIKGASQTGASLITDGWASGATSLKKGDIITIAGVYSVNPLSRVSTGRLQQFTITADTSDSTGDIAALPVSPSLIPSGQLQTVSGSPADNAVITYWSMADGGTQAATVSKVGLIYLPDAFAAVMADLPKPNGGAEVAVVRSKALNVAMRWAQQWDIQTDTNASRIDILVGGAAVRPEFACRVQS